MCVLSINFDDSHFYDPKFMQISECSAQVADTVLSVYGPAFFPLINCKFMVVVTDIGTIENGLMIRSGLSGSRIQYIYCHCFIDRK